jgi:hypothetical protein
LTLAAGLRMKLAEHEPGHELLPSCSFSPVSPQAACCHLLVNVEIDVEKVEQFPESASVLL